MPQLPLQQIRILKIEPWTIPVDSHLIGCLPLSYLALREFRSPDVIALRHPQGIADTLGYLQHHLYELTERQKISENNINTTLAVLTT